MTILCLLPTTPSAREAARMTQCRNNMKQIGLALYNYHDQFEMFPAATAGDPLVSWRVRILAYLDQAHLYNAYRFEQPWDSNENLDHARTTIPVFVCPSNKLQPREADQLKATAYAMLIGPRAFGRLDGEVRLKDVTDETTTTIAVIEACGRNIVWSEPRDVDIVEFPPRVNAPGRKRGESDGWGSSRHVLKGTHALMADGSVKTINQNIDSEVLRRLATIDGGEKVGDF